jgi:hypothetical protein
VAVNFESLEINDRCSLRWKGHFRRRFVSCGRVVLMLLLFDVFGAASSLDEWRLRVAERVWKSSYSTPREDDDSVWLRSRSARPFVIQIERAATSNLEGIVSEAGFPSATTDERPTNMIQSAAFQGRGRWQSNFARMTTATALVVG